MGKKLLSPIEYGRIGGLKHKEDDPDYFKRIGAKGNEKMRELGPEFYKNRARKIAEARRRNRKNSIDKVADLLTGKQ